MWLPKGKRHMGDEHTAAWAAEPAQEEGRQSEVVGVGRRLPQTLQAWPHHPLRPQWSLPAGSLHSEHCHV